MWVDLSTLMFKDGRTHPRLFVHLGARYHEEKHQEQLLNSMLHISKRIVAMSDGNGNGIARPAPILPLSEQGTRHTAAVLRKVRIQLKLLETWELPCKLCRNHLHHANEKLGTHSRLEAVTHAMRRRLI